jgi:MFS family permease
MEKETSASPREVDWTTYDRVSPTVIQTKEGNRVPFKGVVIGRRKFVGILDYILVPLVGGAIVGLFPLYGYKVVQAIRPGWLGSAVFYLCIVLGIALAGFLFWYIFTAKKTNDRDGTANVYLNFETRELGIKNFDGKGRIIPWDSIVKVTAFRFTSLEVGPIGLKFYGRLILTIMKDGKKHLEIVHFVDEPEETAHTLTQILHEKTTL